MANIIYQKRRVKPTVKEKEQVTTLNQFISLLLSSYLFTK